MVKVVPGVSPDASAMVIDSEPRSSANNRVARICGDHWKNSTVTRTPSGVRRISSPGCCLPSWPYGVPTWRSSNVTHASETGGGVGVGQPVGTRSMTSGAWIVAPDDAVPVRRRASQTTPSIRNSAGFSRLSPTPSIAIR